MQKGDKEWFVISSGVAPLYTKASFNSSCLTEMVYGDSCRILDNEDSWIFVEINDGYQGWVKNFYGFRSESKNKHSHIIAFPNENGFFHSKYPFGAKLMKKRTGSIAINKRIKFDSITKVLNSLLGIPYKWGGKTSLGFDCSGLVQSVFQLYKINLPRDSIDQWHFLADYKTNLNNTKKGDLHFFGKNGKVSHVAISCGGLDFIHSQGCVKKESLDKKDPCFNQSLLDIYLSSVDIRLKFTL
tara:strand:+ start:4455 stop:5180 length:726 start_codon:yes stop_codon:yes gene_type:complete